MAAANSYAEGWRAWDERYADLVIGKRNWQLAAGGLLVVSIILAVGMVWLSGRSRYVVYAVEVDKLGYALTQAQPLTPASAPDLTTRIERYEIAAFIRGARSVSSDSQAEQERLNAMHAHARGAADRFLDEYYHADPYITPSGSGRRKPLRRRSIRSWRSQRKLTRCVGRSSGAT